MPQTSIGSSELLFHGGEVITMAAEQDRAEAVLVRDGVIVAVGSLVDCRRAALTDPHVVDLDGATLLPGFVDAHCHPLMYGQFADWVDCGWVNAPDIDSVVERLRSRAGGLEPGKTVWGQGFHHGNVAEQRMLTRHDLDRVAADRAVVVFHSSGHGAIVNSYALAQAQVTAGTADPDGGHFGRDEHGELTGEVWDAAADVLTGPEGVKVGRNGPNFHVGGDTRELVAHLQAAQRKFHAAGITTVVDAQVTLREMSTYLQLHRSGGLTLRVHALMLSSLIDELGALGIHGRLGDDRLAIAGVKLYCDGALTGATARFSEPYCCGGADNHGYLYHDAEELGAMIDQVHRLGLQAATHAQGDAAIEMVLDALESAIGDITDHRHRIEHCGMPSFEQVKRIKQLEVWPITQPQYVFRYGDELERALGDRARRATPLGEFRDADVPVVISSDAPVCPPDPLEAVYAAVARDTLSGHRLGDAAQCLTVEQALRAHTLTAAASVRQERAVGSIEIGKQADFAVLAHDPTSVPVADIPGIEVLETWVAGELVYASAAVARN